MVNCGLTFSFTIQFWITLLFIHFFHGLFRQTKYPSIYVSSWYYHGNLLIFLSLYFNRIKQLIKKIPNLTLIRIYNHE